MPRKHVIVTGRVQGVGFRYTARQRAAQLGVGGFTRNLADGSVEFELEGDEPNLDRMLAWVSSGPPGADVADVRVRDIDELGETTFSVR